MTADTTLVKDKKSSAASESYLLKKGNYVQVATMPTLQNGDIWGPNPAEYDPHRFIKLNKDPASLTVRSADLPPAAFPVWGMAPHICPARQYASTGCMAFVALLVMRFDFAAAEDNGEFEMEPDFAAVSVPKGQWRATVTGRQGWVGEQWDVVVGEKGSKMTLAVA